MRILIWCIGLSWLASLSAEVETTAQAANDWYQNQYAPHWKENAWDKVEVFSRFYDETIHVHPREGTVTVVASRAWLAESLEEWKSDGWLGSDVAGYQSDQLNPSTATFKVKWRDWYANGSEEFSCGWYLADLESDGWVFTQYAEIDCAEHEL